MSDECEWCNKQHGEAEPCWEVPATRFQTIEKLPNISPLLIPFVVVFLAIAFGVAGW